MILKAKERGGGRQLGFYLLKADTNEHVEVYEMRGFVADDLPSALHEIDLISRGTKARKYLFSMSLNPPPSKNVRMETFAAAIDAIEFKLGLEGQPRVIVFHERDGRRHAHAVWSRIDAKRMRAINLSHYKNKLRDVAKGLFLENGWQMPGGFIDSRERDPASYSLAEWQQAKRAGHDPKVLKTMFRECWAASDSGKALAAALNARGFILARGDRRGHVAVDYKGEVYGLARYADVKTNELRKRLGDEKALPSVAEALAEHATRMTTMVRRHIITVEDRHKRQRTELASRLGEVKQRQRREREELEKTQQARQVSEAQERSQRFRRGLGGLWDRLTGKHSAIRRQNEQDSRAAIQRDRSEKDALVFRQRDERQLVHADIKQTRQAHAEQIAELHRDIAGFDQMRARDEVSEKSIIRAERTRERPRRRRGRDFER